MKSFRDKVVVVTAAGSGIGRASAEAYAREGARVHAVDLRADRVDDVATALRRQGLEATPHALDCTDADAMARLSAELFGSEGRVDVLQNGVGALIAAPTDQLSAEDWRRLIDVNLGSVANALAAFLGPMRRQPGESRIVNVASVAGLVGFPYTVAYSATKFAIVGLSEALAFELAGSGVGVTVICPGMVRSNLVSDGVLRLPGRWPAIFDWAYAHLADDPELVAARILRALRRGDTMVAPAMMLSQLWRAKRLSTAGFHKGGQSLVRSLRWLVSLGDR